MEAIKKMKSVTMGIHVGNALKYVTGLYPTLTKVILELIQNSLDSGASSIRIVVDYKNRNLCVRDNGSGITPEKFSQAISLVCSSQKDKSKLGQFGIGMMSPLGKCKGFVITSAARNEKHHYHRWIFDSDRILNSQDFPEIPVIPMPDIYFTHAGAKNVGKREGVDWRTEVNLENFSRDKSINALNISELRNIILGQFAEAMRRLQTSISITVKDKDSPNKETRIITAEAFNGEKLGLIAYGESPSRTLFDIYLSPKTKHGRKGQLVVGIEGNEFRIPLPLFLRSATSEIGQDIANILLSGVFEGSIISSGCKLHPNRKEFMEDEARMNFLIHLESWAKNHGQKHLVSIKDGEKDVWLQAVGSMAISQLEDKLKNQLPHLLEVVKSFRYGTVGSGHYGFERSDREQEFGSARVTFSNRSTKKKGAQKSPADRTPSPHPGHMPMTVEGKGVKRRVVRGHSSGLQFTFEEMLGNDNHWEFDSTSGILAFNMRSDIWARMEVSERNLILYQQYVAIKALELQLVPPTVRETVYEFLQKELKSAMFLIVNSHNIQPRRLKADVGTKC